MSKRHTNIQNGTPTLSTSINLFPARYEDIGDKIPPASVDLIVTDPPYSVMDDYEWDKKDIEFCHQWLSLVKPKLTYLGTKDPLPKGMPRTNLPTQITEELKSQYKRHSAQRKQMKPKFNRLKALESQRILRIPAL